MARAKKRIDGRFQTKVYIGLIDGKKQYKYFYGKTKAESQEKASEYRKLLNAANQPLTTDFQTVALLWLESKKTDVGAGQYTRLKGIVSKLTEQLGEMIVADVTGDDLQSFINRYAAVNPATGRRSSKSSVKKYVEVLKAIFSSAESTAAVKLRVPASPSPNARRALTPEEQEHVRTLEHRAQLPAMIELYAGLRRGEVTALQWTDIDFSAKTITVNKSFDFKSNTLKTTKTAAGIRVVPLVTILSDFLQPFRKKTGHVVTTAAGKPMTESAWRRLWTSYMTDMDAVFGGRIKSSPSNKVGVYSIQPFSQHELRHTYCTMLFDAGVDVKTAQYLMGHADLNTTLNIYTHLTAEHRSLETAKINDFLQNRCQEGCQTNSEMP